MSTYTRRIIREMDGYTPGEQPKQKDLIKLNTNENPYPPSPTAAKLFTEFASERLRLYPDPLADDLRLTIAKIYGFGIDNIMAGNGSDDILNIIIRTFVSENEKIVCFDPSYSLYGVLAKIQNANTHLINLTDDFSIPKDFLSSKLDKLSKMDDLKVFFIANPNSPTGNAFPISEIEIICSKFKGIVVVDEAYADFADDNALRLLNKFDNLIVSRTISKSYSMAGVRLGWAISSPSIIKEMIKVKDSYNVNLLSQLLAIGALKDQPYFKDTISKIRTTRDKLVKRLKLLGFTVIPSQSNFVMASPPNKDGNGLFLFLRSKNILVRYFPSPKTKDYIRITVGKDEDMQNLIDCCKEYISNIQ